MGQVELGEVTAGNKTQFGATAMMDQVVGPEELVWFMLKLLFVVIVPTN